MNALFDALGFCWDREQAQLALPQLDAPLVHFHFQRNMAEFVWDAAQLENNPCTLPQVQTIMSGITVGGLKISDQQQVVNLVNACQDVLSRVKAGSFTADRLTFTALHALVAKEEALKWGVFRGEGQHTKYTPYVALGEHGNHQPLPTEPKAQNLISLFEEGIAALLEHCVDTFEQAAAFFLFGALQQFFFDGNKRTSRLMMNGVLLSNDLYSISIPASRAEEFNEKMVQFYLAKDGTEMMVFLKDCYPSKKAQNDSQVVPVR